MRTPSEIRARVTESMARLRDGQVGADPRGFLGALRRQVLDDAPARMHLLISARLAEMDKLLDERDALAHSSATTATGVPEVE